jgi:hypothetical protein
MRLLILFPALFLSGCFYSLAGIDMSFEGRHKMWLEDMRKVIGKNMFTCESGVRCFQYRGQGSLFQGDTLLENGNKEASYLWWHTQPRCRYFFEYEPRSGEIVGFRFEETERFACRISPA